MTSGGAGADPKRIYPGEATYFLYDHLGNTRVAFQADETTTFEPLTVYCGDYYAYGKMLREYDAGDGDRYLTTMHERDRETGLDYRGARYYDSDVARFLSTDPWASKYPAWSTYNYVKGNPIAFIDPTGKGPMETGLGAISRRLLDKLQNQENNSPGDGGFGFDINLGFLKLHFLFSKIVNAKGDFKDRRSNIAWPSVTAEWRTLRKETYIACKWGDWEYSQTQYIEVNGTTTYNFGTYRGPIRLKWDTYGGGNDIVSTNPDGSPNYDGNGNRAIFTYGDDTYTIRPLISSIGIPQGRKFISRTMGRGSAACDAPGNSLMVTISQPKNPNENQDIFGVMVWYRPLEQTTRTRLKWVSTASKLKE